MPIAKKTCRDVEKSLRTHKISNFKRWKLKFKNLTKNNFSRRKKKESSSAIDRCSISIKRSKMSWRGSNATVMTTLPDYIKHRSSSLKLDY